MTSLQPEIACDLSPEEIANACQFVDEVQMALQETVSGITDDQSRFQPTSECWSIAGILEHLVLTHELILRRVYADLAEGPRPASERDNREIDTYVRREMIESLAKFPAPEMLQPRGEWSLSESMARLAVLNEELRQHLQERSDLRAHVLPAPPINRLSNGMYTDMDGYQWALAAAGHLERHRRQIVRIQSDLRFPCGVR